MIDPDWLKTLNFESIDGYHVNGLAGIGSQNLALKAEKRDHPDVVIRMPKTSLGFHINEIPPSITIRKEYDLAVLNDKLSRLVGREDLDKRSVWLDDLYSYFIKALSIGGIPAVIFSNLSVESVETVPFILNTPPISRRLQEIEDYIDLVIDGDDALARMPFLNGEKYPIRMFFAPELRPTWPKETLEGLTRLSEQNAELNAAGIFTNWLVVWGVAAMEGFFTDEEMPLVADYVNKRFGPALDSENIVSLIGQVDALANLFSQYVSSAPVGRFVKLCAHCGLMFQARDRNGQVVASGLSGF